MIAIISEEEEHYVKLDLLLKGVATRAVRTFFNNEFPSSHLPSTLRKHHNILKRLITKGVLNSGQWNVLFPHYDVLDSERLDITLMICLIRHISAVIPPIKGFDELPFPGETTPGSDLARIKWYRNKIALHPNNRICSTFFNMAWGDISNAVGRLGGQMMYQECAELKVKFMNQSILEFILEIEQSLEEITEQTQTMNILGTEYSQVKENITDILKFIVPLSDEEVNYTRIALLLKGVSARAVRTFFDKEFSQTKLSSTLHRNLNILEQLKSARSLNQAHMNVLFPWTGVADSQLFDVTLMICLIRNLTSVIPPSYGFDCLPDPYEKTPGSDLARIKWYRTILTHVNIDIMDTAFFNKAWQDISDAVGRLGGKTLYQECIELKVKILDQTCQEIMENIKQLVEKMKEPPKIIDVLDTKHSKMPKSRTQLKHKECFNIYLRTEHSKVYEYLKKLESSLATLQIEHIKVKEISEDKIPWNISVRGTCIVIKYEYDTFPRLRLLQTRLNDSMDTMNDIITQSPHIRFICDEKFNRLQLIEDKFSMKGINGQYIQEHDICKTELIVTVCILQPEESGNLSTQDEMFLALLEEIEADTKTVIYVINTMECPSSILERYSIQISERMEPFSSVNTIYNRLFAIDSSEISIRISLYFERRLLDYLPVINTNSGLLENTLTSLELNEQLTAVLAKGPLNGNTCLDNLRRNALDFQLDGDRTHRLPWKIQKVRCQVKNYLFECLSQDISLTLMKYLNDQMISKSKAVADELDKMMDMSMCWIDQLTFDILGIISIRSVPILAFASTPFSIASDLLFSVDVKDVSFRHQIADYIHEHIMAWRTEIIQDVHHRFKETFWKKFLKLCQILNVFGKKNKASISFHEYKTITERNLEIEAYGLFGDIKKIYIHKEKTNEESIRAYLCRYITDLSSINICEYQKMIVSNHCFKSGNKVGVQNRYGTAGFPMKDKNNRYYCTTCDHVTKLVQPNIHSNDGTELFTEVHYSDISLDFSLLKLRDTDIVCNHGIRTEDNCYVSGEVLENDMTPDKDDKLYKWGAKTGLTIGKYAGSVFERKHDTYKYDVESILIEGQLEQFSKAGDSGSLICISPDSIVYTSHMAACILVGKVLNYDNDLTPNRYMCYRVSHPLSDMRRDESCFAIEPCFSM